MIGHDGQVLGKLDSDDIEAGPNELHIQAESPLEDRLHAVVQVLGWADPFAFSEQEGETVMPLPSPRRIHGLYLGRNRGIDPTASPSVTAAGHHLEPSHDVARALKPLT